MTWRYLMSTIGKQLEVLADPLTEPEHAELAEQGEVEQLITPMAPGGDS